MKRVLLAVGVMFGATAPALAADINQIDQLLQGEFRKFSEDLTAALSYKAVVPAEPLGITGFDLGLEVTATQLQHADIYDKATSDNRTETLYLPKVHVHKGLPLGIDLGASYASVPNSNVKLWGAEIRYALWPGSTLSPALGVRGTYTKLSGVSQLDFDTRGLELTISKGIVFFTPYGGIGRVWTTSAPRHITNVTKEEFAENKYYVGGNFNFALINFALEADKTGDATSYSAKFGWRF